MSTSKGIDLSSAMEAAIADTGLSFDDEALADPFVPVQPATDVNTQEPLDGDLDNVEEPETEEISFAKISLIEEPAEAGVGEVDWNMRVSVPGLGDLSLLELRDGYLRQDDYTRKTQELAELRRSGVSNDPDLEHATRLYDMLKTDPMGTIRQLAAEAGLIDEKVTPNPNVKLPSAVNQDEIADLVEQRVQETLKNRPEMQALARQQLAEQTNAEFNRISQAYAVPLGTEERIAILSNAAATKSNLELTFLRMKQKADALKAEQDRIKGASTTVEKARVPERDVTTERPRTVEESYERALAQLIS